MAYRATKSKKVVEDLELVDESGEVAGTIHVELSPGKVANNLSRKYLELIHAQKYMRKINEKRFEPEETAEVYQKIGKITLDMMESIFGKEDTAVILDFYENDYVEMLQKIMPFITEVILPEVRSMAQENKEEILQRYNRKTRRTAKKKGMFR